MISGIYTITNRTNNKLYLGRSVNVFRRLKEHKRNLNVGRHCNQHLQSAYNLNPDNFLFEVLEFYPEDLLPDMEQYWLNQTLAYDRNYGYCKDQSGYNGVIGKLSQETKNKLSKAHKGKICSRESVERTRLKNLRQKRPTQSIKMKANWEKVKHKMGLTNLSEERYRLTVEKLSNAQKVRYLNPENLPKTAKPVTVEFCDSTFKTYPSLHKAAKALGIDRGVIKYAQQHTNGVIKKLNCKIKS